MNDERLYARFASQQTAGFLPKVPVLSSTAIVFAVVVNAYEDTYSSL
jgi:hypothetical protein